MPLRGGIGRDEAAVMLALLAGSADGKPQPEEEAAILARLGPQLERLGPKGQQETLRLLAELLETVGLDHTLSSIRAALLVPRDRVDAVRTAVEVAFADGQLAPVEARRVAHIADAMGLDEADLRSVLASRVAGRASGLARTGATDGATKGKAR